MNPYDTLRDMGYYAENDTGGLAENDTAALAQIFSGECDDD